MKDQRVFENSNSHNLSLSTYVLGICLMKFGRLWGVGNPSGTQNSTFSPFKRPHRIIPYTEDTKQDTEEAGSLSQTESTVSASWNRPPSLGYVPPMGPSEMFSTVYPQVEADSTPPEAPAACSTSAPAYVKSMTSTDLDPDFEFRAPQWIDLGSADDQTLDIGEDPWFDVPHPEHEPLGPRRPLKPLLVEKHPTQGLQIPKPPNPPSPHHSRLSRILNSIFSPVYKGIKRDQSGKENSERPASIASIIRPKPPPKPHRIPAQLFSHEERILPPPPPRRLRDPYSVVEETSSSVVATPCDEADEQRRKIRKTHRPCATVSFTAMPGVIHYAKGAE